MIFIFTGEQGSGKTTFLKQVLEILYRKNLKVSGILAEGHWENSLRSGFEIVDIETGEKTLLCNRSEDAGDIAYRNFWFKPGGLAFGKKILNNILAKMPDIIAIDEMGGFEIENGGWAENIDQILRRCDTPMIWTVRQKLTEAVIQKWPLNDYQIFNVETDSVLSVTKAITCFILDESKKSVGKEIPNGNDGNGK